MALPEQVRAHVTAWAAQALTALPPDRVPASLQHVARFTPSRRARLGAAALAAALESDPVFRQQAVVVARAAHPALAAALADGTPVPAAPPAEVAALAYLLRAEGWEDHVARAEVEAQQAVVAAGEQAQAEEVWRLSAELDRVRAAGAAELAAAQERARAAEAELTEARRKVRDLGARIGRAEQAQRAAEQDRDAFRAEAEGAGERAQAEVRRVQDHLAEVEAALARARQGVRDQGREGQLRARLLLDALLGAAQGLRRELALPPVEGRPADSLEADYAVTSAGSSGTAGAGTVGDRGRYGDDPALLDALLVVPGTHVLVDGYNVTKGGYGDLTLQAQRTRLLAGLGALAARTGAEVTVVFDGRDGAVPAALPAPRGVRLLFSRTGETADEVLRRLVRHEPAGRPLVVVSSDREVADGVRADGARAVPSSALHRLLDR